MMKQLLLISTCIALLAINGCKKTDDTNDPVDTTVTELKVLTDFAYVLANPNYQDIQEKANALNVAAQALSASTTEDNLKIAQDAWRAVRVPWEQCEGFLFGPGYVFWYRYVESYIRLFYFWKKFKSKSDQA